MSFTYNDIRHISSPIQHVIATTAKVDHSLTNDPFSTLSLKITHGYAITKKKMLHFVLDVRRLQ